MTRNRQMVKFLLLLATTGLLLALCHSARAQEPTLSIRKMGGWNDIGNPLTQEPGQAVVSINWNYSKMFGGINKRDGYSVKYDATCQPLGLYGYVNNNGKKYLLMVRNVTSDNVAGLYTSALRTSAPSSGVAGRYLFKNGTPFYTQYNDIVIVSDGKTPALRWNGSNGDYLTWPRPGSPQFTAVNAHTTGWVLQGDYYYSWQVTHPCSTTANYGPLSGTSYQVHVDSGMVFVGALSDVAASGLCADPMPYPTGAVSYFRLCRTRANKEPTDSMFQVYIKGGLASYDAWTFYDSVPDCSLGVTAYAYVDKVDTVTYTASILSDSGYRIGQCNLVSIDSVGNPFAGVSAGLDIADTSWVATRYFTMWYDSDRKSVV